MARLASLIHRRPSPRLHESMERAGTAADETPTALTRVPTSVRMSIPGPTDGVLAGRNMSFNLTNRLKSDWTVSG